MSHLSISLPTKIEQGAIRDLDYQTEVVTTDGGYEVRNARWLTPLRRYEVSFPTSDRTDATYQAVLDLYTRAQGGLNTFNFTDWTSGATVKVRFDSALKITGIDRRLDHIETLTLVEVR